ncbi:hypothetical protein CRU98_09675 [Arcobacter sp. CECT 8986]|uniref:two-partner secretion domain-containing protein n=1 Tax=Arcobacter sp. CECT 8986 TaxID=2044507 RepID=UPI0010099EFC|nr:filamentous hemagglutinin N-terminal domain-containing protein [Arcobacter sp. CECT 8986]RXJ98628.1 hypothetical protein CRU98_09675 [Arcobacter sp. CECT 8986]
MIYNFSSRFKIIKGGKISLIVSALITSLTPSFASPTGGKVTSGNATITQNKTVTTINQTSNKATINWKNFSIASNETVNFKQPNSKAITLNRVTGNEKSIINGALNANGQVWILNSNGVLFGKNAVVNTSGILATTAKLSDKDFNEGKYTFKDATANLVINQGTIEVSNRGSVILASNEVINEGSIKAIRGNVHLVGSDSYSINMNGNSLVDLRVDKGVLDSMVSNKGTISADGGEIYLTTNAVNELLKGVVNNTGIIEANSIDDLKGHIELFAHGGEAQIDGTISANTGFIETSGSKINFSDNFIINAGKGGTWLIDPNNIRIVSDATAEKNLDILGGEYKSSNDSTVLRASTIESHLNNGTSVAVITASAGTNLEDGDIFLETNINKTSGGDAVLTLKAHRNIVFADRDTSFTKDYTGPNSYGSISSSSNKLHVVLWSDSDGNNNGSVWIPKNSSISTNGGNVWIGGGAGDGPTMWSGITVGDSYAVGSSFFSNEGKAIARGASINGNINANGSTSGGDIYIKGLASQSSYYTSARGVSIAGSIITNHQGNITIEGTAKGVSDAVALGDAALSNGAGILRVEEGTILINGHSNTSSNSSDSFYLNNGSYIDDNQKGLGTLIINGNDDEMLSDSSSYINIGKLLVKNGSVTLDNINNNISLLAGDNLSSLSYVDADSLTIGTVDSTNGITAQGPINIATNTGDLIIENDINSSDSGDSAIVLNAGKSQTAGTSTGGDIKYISGSLNTTGRVTLYTGSVNESSIASLVSNGNFRYNSDETTSGYDLVNAALGSGTYAIYREQPTIEVTANNDSFVYDGRVYTGGNGAIYSGFVNNDTSSILNGTLNYSGTSQGATNVGTYTISPNGLSNYLGYNINFINGQLVIEDVPTTPKKPTKDSTPIIKDSLIPKSDLISKTNLPKKDAVIKPNNLVKVFNQNQNDDTMDIKTIIKNLNVKQNNENTNIDISTKKQIDNKISKQDIKTDILTKKRNENKISKQNVKTDILAEKRNENKIIDNTAKKTDSNEKQAEDKKLDKNISTDSSPKLNRYKLDDAQIEIRVNENGKIIFSKSEINVVVENNGQLVLPRNSADILATIGMSVKTIRVKNNKIEINILDKKSTKKYSATLENGKPLPKYLKFDNKTGKITGTLPKGIKKANINIEAISKDNTIRVLNVKMRIK